MAEAPVLIAHELTVAVVMNFHSPYCLEVAETQNCAQEYGSRDPIDIARWKNPFHAFGYHCGRYKISQGGAIKETGVKPAVLDRMYVQPRTH